MMKKERFMAWIPGIVLGVFLMIVIGSCTNPDLGTVESASSDMTDEQAAIATISNISTENLLGKIRITIAADSELSYTAFKLSDPLRLVLDLPNSETADLSEITFEKPNKDILRNLSQILDSAFLNLFHKNLFHLWIFDLSKPDNFKVFQALLNS